MYNTSLGGPPRPTPKLRKYPSKSFYGNTIFYNQIKQSSSNEPNIKICKLSGCLLGAVNLVMAQYFHCADFEPSA